MHLASPEDSGRLSIHSEHTLPPFCRAALSQHYMERHRRCPLVATVRLLRAGTVWAARPASWRAVNQWLRLEGSKS